MIQGMTIEELAQTVVRHASGKEDFLVPASSITFSKDKDNAIHIALPSDRAFKMTSNASGQVTEFLGIPRRFANTLQAQVPDLLLTNLNTLTARQPARRLLRVLDSNARAFLSDSYRRVDNEEVFDGIYPALRALGATIESCNISDDYMHIQAIMHHTEGEIRVGDVVKSGLVISNSEVGRGALTVRRMLWRKVCSNGMIVQEPARRQAHIGGSWVPAEDNSWLALSPETQRLKVKAMVAEFGEYLQAISTGERFEALISKLRDAADTPLPAEPKVVVESLAARYDLRAPEADSALLALAEGRDYSRWGLANAITYVANSSDSYDRGVELEAVGGSIMAMGKGAWSELALVPKQRTLGDE